MTSYHNFKQPATSTLLLGYDSYDRYDRFQVIFQSMLCDAVIVFARRRYRLDMAPLLLLPRSGEPDSVQTKRRRKTKKK